MITAVHIDKFKSFEGVKIEGLGRLNAFVGSNNAGKSTVLHALHVASLFITGKEPEYFPFMANFNDVVKVGCSIKLIEGEGNEYILNEADGKRLTPRR